MRLVGNDRSCPVAHQTWKRARKKERKKERKTTLESRELSGFFPLFKNRCSPYECKNTPRYCQTRLGYFPSKTWTWKAFFKVKLLTSSPSRIKRLIIVFQRRIPLKAPKAQFSFNLTFNILLCTPSAYVIPPLRTAFRSIYLLNGRINHPNRAYYDLINTR